ncbi:MAG TPA: polyketide cyclase / dehydrase and lipid transport [Micromonosporaceae bacterium]
MPAIDLVEETFVAAHPALVRARVATPEFLRELWPDLRLRVSEDRGREGLRFVVAGALTGTAEVWLEEWADGVIVHLYLRADPAGWGWAARRALREQHHSRATARLVLWQVKDELEAGRRPGQPARR